jgi:hypothetical protein
VAKVTDGENKDSYTEDKVVLSFHGKIFFCLTQGGVRQATRPVTHQRVPRPAAPLKAVNNLVLFPDEIVGLPFNTM